MNDQQPVVSVIIPCYNQGAYLNEAVESVLNQTFQSFEIVVINDGSTDATTVELFQAYEKPKVRIIHTQNQGPALARNLGIQETTGRYILPLDADDRISPNYLEHTVKVLDEQPNVGLVYGEAEFFGERTGHWDLPPYRFPDILIVNCIFNTSLYRRADWEAVGGYKKNTTHGMEDYNLWLSLIELGRKVVQVSGITFFYRQTHTSRSNRRKLNDQVKCHTEVFKNHTQLYIDNIECIFNKLYELRYEFEEHFHWKHQIQAELAHTQAQLYQTQTQLNQAQTELAHGQTQLSHAQAELAQTQTQLSQAQTELAHTQAQLSQAHVELGQTQAELLSSREQISAMQSSKFWKLRTAWFRVKRWIGLTTETH
jgi:glycosyltransferase involved in cell wall biosynthesis